MKLTRRGYALVAIVVVGVILGWRFGTRALDAIVGPSLVALVLAAIQVRRAGAPGVERILPAPGFPGERRRMRLRLDAGGTATVRDQLAEGLSPRSVERVVSGETTVEYEVTCERRGAHDVGPATVCVRDVFGLVEQPFTAGGDDTLLVYPAVHPIRAPGALSRLVNQQGASDRQAFDRLREYVPGDSLRDVHWKTVAKRQDDLVVMEFAADTEGGVTVAAETPDDADDRAVDAMASAAASVVAYLLARGVEVELTANGSHLDRGVGDEQRLAALEALATTPPGGLPARATADADVHIDVEDGRAVVEIDGTRVPFETLVGADAPAEPAPSRSTEVPA